MLLTERDKEAIKRFLENAECMTSEELQPDVDFEACGTVSYVLHCILTENEKKG